jgi:hypothetical protein
MYHEDDGDVIVSHLRLKATIPDGSRVWMLLPTHDTNPRQSSYQRSAKLKVLLYT